MEIVSEKKIDVNTIELVPMSCAALDACTCTGNCGGGIMIH
jgi:hypothetical protein